MHGDLKFLNDTIESLQYENTKLKDAMLSLNQKTIEDQKFLSPEISPLVRVLCMHSIILKSTIRQTHSLQVSNPPSTSASPTDCCQLTITGSNILVLDPTKRPQKTRHIFVLPTRKGMLYPWLKLSCLVLVHGSCYLKLAFLWTTAWCGSIRALDHPIL